LSCAAAGGRRCGNNRPRGRAGEPAVGMPSELDAAITALLALALLLMVGVLANVPAG
jgi:hypothetical protein